MHLNNPARDSSSTWQWTLTALATAVLAACGGGGGGSDAPVAPSSVISGAIVKGPVAGSHVCAYRLLPAGKGTQLGCTTTAADGSYSLALSYSGDVIVEATGGSYTDEVTGVTNTGLGTPLTVAGSVGPGSQELVATPLTTLALNKALAGGSLTVAGFEASAGEVASAFGLPADMKLAKTRPVVTGATNAYGDVMIGVSKMLGEGATLTGIVTNTDLTALSSGYLVANQEPCTANVPVSPAETSSLAGGIYIDGEGDAADGMDFSVIGPVPAWRDLLPGTGEVMDCKVISNTPQQVDLFCPASALIPAYSFLGNVTEIAAPAALPADGVLLAGLRIEGRGQLPASSQASARADAIEIGTLKVSADPLQINGCPGGLCIDGVTLGASGNLSLSTVSTSPGLATNALPAGNLVLSGKVSVDLQSSSPPPSVIINQTSKQLLINYNITSVGCIAKSK